MNIIKEIQLGKSVEDVVKDHFLDLYDEDFHILDLDVQVPEIVKKIVGLNKPDLNFAVEITAWACKIIALNGDCTVPLEYWDDQYSEAKSEVYADCEFLNKIVEKLFGPRKKTRTKITGKEYSQKRRCPYCLGTKMVVLDRTTYSNKVEMGCNKCGSTWDEKIKTVVTGFSK
jgi:hypothetical protein